MDKISWIIWWNNCLGIVETIVLGIILCAEKNSETVELLELDNSGIHVAQYFTTLPAKEIIEEKLRVAIERAQNIVSINGHKSNRE